MVQLVEGSGNPCHYVVSTRCCGSDAHAGRKGKQQTACYHQLLTTLAWGDFFHPHALDVLTEHFDGPEGVLSRLVALDGTGDIPECAWQDGLSRIPLLRFQSSDFALHRCGL